ncbi:MAG: FAD-linked oxidase C-terminal domain-containing protein [Candidatus Brocadia sp.]
MARQIIEWRWTVSAEHDVGKIKRKYLLDMFGQWELREMALIKRISIPV